MPIRGPDRTPIDTGSAYRRLGTGRVPALRTAGDPGLLVDRSCAATAKRTPAWGKMRIAQRERLAMRIKAMLAASEVADIIFRHHGSDEQMFGEK